MIEMIGPVRAAIIVMLLALNLSLGYAYYNYLSPNTELYEMQIGNVSAENRALRENVLNLKSGFTQIRDKLSSFKKLEARGFFTDQSRDTAQTLFNEFRLLSNLLAVRYQIRPPTIVRDNRAKEADYVILKSAVTVDMEAVDDVDVYSFVALLKNNFPGDVEITKLTIEQAAPVSDFNISEIAAGTSVVMVKANLEFYWRTMYRESDLSL